MMGGLGPLLASFAATDIAAFTRKVKRNAILFSLILICVLTAYGLAVAALAVYFAGLWGVIPALLAVAGGALILAVFIYLAVAIANAAEERRKREQAAINSSKAMMVTAALTTLPLLVKSRPLMVASVLGGIGFVLLRGLGGNSQSSDPE